MIRKMTILPHVNIKENLLVHSIFLVGSFLTISFDAIYELKYVCQSISLHASVVYRIILLQGISCLQRLVRNMISEKGS